MAFHKTSQDVPPSGTLLRERKEDIILLFRKFAVDFAEKYKAQIIHSLILINVRTKMAIPPHPSVNTGQSIYQGHK